MDDNWYCDEDTDEELDEFEMITDAMLAAADASLEAQFAAVVAA